MHSSFTLWLHGVEWRKLTLLQILHCETLHSLWQISLPMDICTWGWRGSENSHFLGISLNHILLPQIIACATQSSVHLHRFSNFLCQKKFNIINSVNLTSPSLKMSGNLHTKYLRMCAKRGIFMAVHVRNMLPMSPLDTGALSGTKQFITAPRSCHLSNSSCNFSWHIQQKNSIAHKHSISTSLFGYCL